MASKRYRDTVSIGVGGAGTCTASFPFAEGAADVMRSLGGRWRPNPGVWSVPSEREDDVYAHRELIEALVRFQRNPHLPPVNVTAMRAEAAAALERVRQSKRSQADLLAAVIEELNPVFGWGRYRVEDLPLLRQLASVWPSRRTIAIDKKVTVMREHGVRVTVSMPGGAALDVSNHVEGARVASGVAQETVTVQVPLFASDSGFGTNYSYTGDGVRVSKVGQCHEPAAPVPSDPGVVAGQEATQAAGESGPGASSLSTRAIKQAMASIMRDASLPEADREFARQWRRLRNPPADLTATCLRLIEGHADKLHSSVVAEATSEEAAAPKKKGKPGRKPVGDIAMTASERNKKYKLSKAIVTLEVPAALAERLRAARDAKGLSTSDYLASLLDAAGA